MHLEFIERKDHRLIRDIVDEQLTFSPGDPSRNRKPLEQPAPFGATWELRFGPENRFRIFYELAPDAKVVHVLAVGIKERNKLVIAGQEFEP